MPRRLLLLGFLLLALPLAAVTRDNDDSCDVALLPAATLLLPAFEVELGNLPGPTERLTTRFTITNVTNADRVAHVTLWTDYAYPVLGFNVYLTGYDVQRIDLFQVIERGLIEPTGTTVRARGGYSRGNPALDTSACGFLPGALPLDTIARMKAAFTTGNVAGCGEIGSPHARAIGYATIDVVGSCSTAGVQESEYWTRDLRYDNVLTGDYEVIDASGAVAQGGPLVHIRAIPEGGTPELRRAAPVTFDAGFQRTFYSRHQPANAPRLDGRQPLPARFAPRWIQGGPGELRTSLKVWRESAVPAGAPCSAFAANGIRDAVDLVRFDENENGAGRVPASRLIVPTFPAPGLNAASIVSVADDSLYPQLTNGSTAGWFALNLDAAPDDGEVTQSWVISSMSALGRFSTDTEAAALGNGCSPEARISRFSASGGAPIEPSPNVNRNPRIGQASTNNDDSCDIALLPAATLLVPSFRVDLEPTRSETTLLSITNVSAEERIARVTLWTDHAFPLLTFNVFLTGYDVQSIDLFDVIARGVVVAPGCERLPGTLGPEWIARMRTAFMEGSVPECDVVGGFHTLAIGYATIDVVRNCAMTAPTEASYWSRDLAFDNVLIGDYQLVANGAADGAPMVHIRAIPEGGGETALPRTFYGRFQSAAAPRRDARQPLPTTFAARWSTANVETIMEIWREGATRGDASCADLRQNFAPSADIVKFDDRENAIADISVCARQPCPELEFRFPATSRSNVRDYSIYPLLANGATEGWIYFNLDRPGDERSAQAWVVATRLAFGRHAVRADATPLGNGCSTPPAGRSEVTAGGVVIGPAPDRNPR
ncbi:MAG TPA: hypothetical protein VEO54_00965 [Thermoanaerobaculia bacterium]|nr:hypothetical protein [Thermoanaerobaculia bacterium]